MSANSNFLFVYGTLLQRIDHPMSDFLRNYSKRIGKAYFPGRLYNVSWFPAATYDAESPYKVQGELVELNRTEEVFAVLDPYEDFNPTLPDESLYTRELIPVLMGGKSMVAWVYLFARNTSDLEFIPEGNYTAYLANNT